MKPTIIGHNWFFPSLSLWLSYNWLWTPSNGELIDSGLNFSLFNNYAAIGRAEENQQPPLATPPSPFLFVMRGIISAVLSNLSPTIHRALLSGKVAAGWKMSPSEVHEGVKLQTPLCPRPCASKGISSFIDRAGWMSGSRRRRSPPARHILLQPWLLLFPGHLLSIAATFPISQGLLYEDRRLLRQPLPGKCT